MFTTNEDFEGVIKSNAPLSDIEILENEIKLFLNSDARRLMLTGSKYYKGNQDILQKKRKVIGSDGSPTVVENLPNNIILDNRYSFLVDQKVNYILSKPMEVKADHEAMQKNLDDVFNKNMRRKLKNIGIDCINEGIAYLHPYIDNGMLKFKRFSGHEILPFWADDEHETLEGFARIYKITEYVQKTPKVITKVDVYTLDGVRYFELDNEKLKPVRDVESYLNIDGQPYNWEKIPLIPFKYNNDEIPLIARVKCLQDALNELISRFTDNVTEDVHSTILVLRNYEGEDLSRFRYNLATYGVVKVGSSLDGTSGDVSTLSIEVNANNYQLIIGLIKKAIIENGRGFDAKDDRMSNNPNQMNIRSMYADIDLDANNIETEFQASLEELVWFTNTFNGIKGNVADGDVQFIFNRDVLINESEAINNCRASVGVLSMETIIANHPWTIDTADEMARVKAEQQEQMEDYIKTVGGEVVE